MSSLIIFITAISFLLLLSFIWYIIYSRYLHKIHREQELDYQISSIKHHLVNNISNIQLTDVDVDDNITEVLKYIEPSKFTKELLQSLYE